MKQVLEGTAVLALVVLALFVVMLLWYWLAVRCSQTYSTTALRTCLTVRQRRTRRNHEDLSPAKCRAFVL